MSGNQRELFGRREFVKRAGAAGLAVSSGGVLAACGVKKSSSGGSTSAIKIGYVSPLTGEAASFGEPDTYVLGVVRKAIASGITGSDGKHYSVQIIQKDSQSSPQTAASVANDLINGAGIDLMLTTSTPEVVNPVSSACEAAGMPCISTVVPWEAWYFGRGAKPTNKAAFKYTYHFSFGVENFAATYISQWHLLPTNKVVGALYPNDSDGNAVRMGLIPLLEKGGFKVIDAGPYDDGLNDFSSQIATFKAHKCEILNTFPLPPDFATFWRQAIQQGYKPIIAQIAKTGLFPSQVEALGSLGPTPGHRGVLAPGVAVLLLPDRAVRQADASRVRGDGQAVDAATRRRLRAVGRRARGAQARTESEGQGRARPLDRDAQGGHADGPPGLDEGSGEERGRYHHPRRPVVQVESQARSSRSTYS